ncbi:hypothetical protein AB0P40_22065, partial [Streptomyces sp. NPDC079189]
MTTFPGPLPGYTPPRRRPNSPARRTAGRGHATTARQALVVLLLVVLTVVGGASAAVAAAGGVTPPRSLSGPASAAAHTPTAPTPAQRTDRTARPGPPHDTRRARTDNS